MGVGSRLGQIHPGNAPRKMGSQIQRPDKDTIQLITLGAAPIVIAILVIGAVIVGVIPLTQPTLPRCPPTEGITITQVTFGATAGQATFALWNSGTRAVTIVQVSAQGGRISGSATISLSSGNVVPAGRTLSLTVIFPGVTFQNGTRYDFTLASACENKIPTSAIP